MEDVNWKRRPSPRFGRLDDLGSVGFATGRIHGAAAAPGRRCAAGGSGSGWEVWVWGVYVLTSWF